MYTVSIPVFVQHLNGLNTVLEKAASWAAARKVNETDLLNMRLSPDMFNLARQVRAATDHAVNAAARLSGKDPLKFANDETTIPQLKERIAKTIDYLKSIKQPESTAARLRTSASPSRADRHASSQVRAFCLATACPISTSTPQQLTTSFGSAAWSLESAILWVHRRHEEAAPLAASDIFCPVVPLANVSN
jgi:hypothetical protein